MRSHECECVCVQMFSWGKMSAAAELSKIEPHVAVPALGQGTMTRAQTAQMGEPRPMPLKADIVQLAACGYRAAAVLTTGLVLSWGGGQGGLLGHGDEMNRIEPRIVRSLDHVRVQKIALSESTSFAITTTNLLFWWGRMAADLGAADGEGRPPGHHYTPCICAPFRNTMVSSVGCGLWHAIVLTADHDVYTWGSGSLGQLGLGELADHDSPCRVDALIEWNVCEVGGGGHQSIAITDSGHLFTWGDGSSGQLGHNSKESHTVPKMVEALAGVEKMVSVSCALTYMAALSQKGELFTWGTGASGQLGHGPGADKTRAPKKIAVGENMRFKSVSCADEHICALTTAGNLYTWGGGSCLGHPDEVEKAGMPTKGDRDKDCWDPRFLQALCKRAGLAACGQNFMIAVCAREWLALHDETLSTGADEQMLPEWVRMQPLVESQKSFDASSELRISTDCSTAQAHFAVSTVQADTAASDDAALEHVVATTSEIRLPTLPVHSDALPTLFAALQSQVEEAVLAEKAAQQQAVDTEANKLMNKHLQCEAIC